MRFEIGAMSVGDILDRGLKILLARLPVYYFISLIVQLPVLAVQLALPFIQSSDAAAVPGLGQAVAVLIGALGVLVLTLILQPMGIAAILHIIAQEFI